MTQAALARLVADAARAHGDRIALRDESGALSYRTLLADAQSLAGRLAAQRVAPGEPVLVRVSNQPNDFVAMLAVWLAGAVVVPVHRTAPEAVVQAMLAKAACRLCIDLHAGVDVAAAIGAVAGTGIAANAVTPAATEAAIGTGAAPEVDTLLRGAALVIFTSGSTGLPKGVVLTHDAFADKLRENQRILQFGPDEVTLLVLNNTFSFGIWVALLTLHQGGTVVARSRFAPEAFVRDLAEQRITRTAVVPTMIRATFAALDAPVLDDAARRIRAAGALEDVVIGGESLGAELSARLRAFIAPAQLYDIYGLTETSTCDFVLTPAMYAGHPDSIGRPAPGVAARIVDAHGGECAAGAAGELQIDSRFIMAGYLGDDALTRAAFDGRWFRTGDLARRDDEGFVSIVGRLKELIVRGGNKITPLEVERALAGCEGVAAAMAAGIADPVLGQRIVALLVAAPGARIDATRLRAELAARLERFKLPDACYIAAQLPTGRTGKLDRAQLPALIAGGALQPLPQWTGTA